MLRGIFFKTHIKRFLLIIAVSTICFFVGIFSSRLSVFFKSAPESASNMVRAGKGPYVYINPLLLCENNEKEFVEFTPLKKEMEHITALAKAKGTITSGSVYFRDLTNGKWTGINENDLYTPASLLKVPILIAYLKSAEKNQGLLEKTAYYQQEPGQIPPLVKNLILTSGHSYSVEDLLRGMIIDSDNTAKAMLEGGIDRTFLSEVYSELGIPSPYSDPANYQISTRTYALFFRVLYNATFLSHDMSEKALGMLSEVVFDKGLRAGVPGLQIAHKYGYSIIKKDEPRAIELSDCGIIYEPERPYLQCVMARGADSDMVATYIRDIASVANRLIKAE